MSAIAVPVAVAPARRRPRLRAILWAVDVAVFLGALVAYASIPTGTQPTDCAPRSANTRRRLPLCLARAPSASALS